MIFVLFQISSFHVQRKMFEESKPAITFYIFLGLKQYIKHELKDHASWQHRMLLILRICIHALLNGTHPLHTDTGQLIEMVCSVYHIRTWDIQWPCISVAPWNIWISHKRKTQFWGPMAAHLWSSGTVRLFRRHI